MFEGDEGVGTEMPFVHQDREFGGSSDVTGLGMFTLGEEGFLKSGGAEILFGRGGSDLLRGGEVGLRDEGSGFANGPIASAAAKVAAKLVRDGGGVVLDAASRAFGHGADEAGGAVATLGAIAGDHCGLDWMQFIVRGESFGGEEFATNERMDEGEAAVDGAGRARRLEKKEGARAAISLVAAYLGSGEAVEAEKLEDILMERGRRDVGGFSIDSDGGGHCCLLGDAVDVFVVKVGGGLVANGSEPLRAVGSHPNGIARMHGIVFFFEAIDAVATEHQQTVFHNVSLHEGESGAGLVGEDINGEIEGGMDRKEGLEKGSLVAHKGFGFNIVNVTVGNGGGGMVEVRLIDFPEDGEAGFGLSLKSDFGVRWKVDEGTGGELKG